MKTLITMILLCVCANGQTNPPKLKPNLFIGIANVSPIGKPLHPKGYGVEFNFIWALNDRWSFQAEPIIPVGAGRVRPALRLAIAVRVF